MIGPREMTHYAFRIYALRITQLRDLRINSVDTIIPFRNHSLHIIA